MLEVFFFILGLVNSVLLILIFLIRKRRPALLERIGRLYLLLAIPAAFGIYLNAHEEKTVRYAIFLGIFLAYLLLEWLLDFVLKINFRENLRHNWKFAVPYLAFYYAINYGFIVIPWKTSLDWGIIMLCLFIIQIIANIWSHPK